ncbi:amino acid transporter, putative [Ricinus communis]|uniref:Amino acid transporter, putative n=1 Tax=Ricinus communis TaxID=3988 RepID=B9SY27_RICCO|nr:amino acid transporter, putative [Ricinus communis]
MSTMVPNSINISTTKDKENSAIDPPLELDAGALFVLKSRGCSDPDGPTEIKVNRELYVKLKIARSWLHCGYHLTTSIVGPVIFSLPFALALLGWGPGLVCITLAALVTFYSYNLLSLVLEHHAQLGKRQLRFRDMARDILGPRSGKYFMGPLQFAICYGAVIGCTLLGGQSLKTRNSKNSPPKDYYINGCKQNVFFGSINAISIISTTYASGIIPEIHATIAPPVKGKMFKGLCICYTVIVTTFFNVAISGYWAFGNQAKETILTNFMDDGKPLLPTWFFFFMTNIFILMQLVAITVICLQPTNELFEKWFADPKMDQFSIRNVIPRLIFRSLSVIIGTMVAAMLPFFRDIIALFGAFGCIPLDFILPMVFYNVTFKPSKQSQTFWINTLIAAVSSILAAVGAVASVRQIVVDAKTYSLFANM